MRLGGMFIDEDQYDRRREAMLAAAAAGQEFNEDAWWETEGEREQLQKEARVGDKYEIPNQNLLTMMNQLMEDTGRTFAPDLLLNRLFAAKQLYDEKKTSDLYPFIATTFSELFGDANEAAYLSPFTGAVSEWLSACYVIDHPESGLVPMQRHATASYAKDNQFCLDNPVYSTQENLGQFLGKGSRGIYANEAAQTKEAQEFARGELTKRFEALLTEVQDMGLTGHFEQLMRQRAERWQDERIAAVLATHLSYPLLKLREVPRLTQRLVRFLDDIVNGEND